MGSCVLVEFRDWLVEKVLNLWWFINKDEVYRFIDVRFLKNFDIFLIFFYYVNILDFVLGNCFVVVWMVLFGCFILVWYLVKFL